MRRYDIPEYPVWEAKAWTAHEVRTAVEGCLDEMKACLPPRGEWLFLKPDLSSDRPGLLGSTTDLRVLVAVIEALQDRGYRRIMLGAAPPSAVARAGVQPIKRLRIDRVIERYGLRFLDLNRVPFVRVKVFSGEVRVARAALEAGLLINLPALRTHADAGLVMAMGGLKGLVRTADRPKLAASRFRNLVALAERFPRLLSIVDGLVVMEGDGPLNGSPLRFGRLFWGESVFTLDLLIGRLLGYTVEEIPHLWRAVREHILPLEAQIHVEQQVRIALDLRRPSARGPTFSTSTMMMSWVQNELRSRSESPGWSRLARLFQLRLTVDSHNDSLHDLRRDASRCGTCQRCVEVCPTGLTREEIGRFPPHARCIECLYCVFVCDEDALSLQGDGGALMALMQGAKPALLKLIPSPSSSAGDVVEENEPLSKGASHPERASASSKKTL